MNRLSRLNFSGISKKKPVARLYSGPAESNMTNMGAQPSLLMTPQINDQAFMTISSKTSDQEKQQKPKNKNESGKALARNKPKKEKSDEKAAQLNAMKTQEFSKADQQKFQKLIESIEQKCTIVLKEKIYFVIRKMALKISKSSPAEIERMSEEPYKNAMIKKIKLIAPGSDLIDEVKNFNFRTSLQNLDLEMVIKRVKKYETLFLANRETMIINDIFSNLGYQGSSGEQGNSREDGHRTQRADMYEEVITRKADVGVFNIMDGEEILKISQPKCIKPNHWIYLDGLPYEFDMGEMREAIDNTLGRYGEIDQVFFMQTKDFIEKEFRFDKIKLDTRNRDEIIDLTNKLADINVKSESFKKKFWLDNSTEDLYVSNNITKKANKVFDRFREHAQSKFNNSVAFVRFKKHEDKTSVLNDDVRLFGLYIKNKCYRLENAEFKRTLKINNVPFGVAVGQIIDKINSELHKNNLPVFDVPINYQKQMITGQTFYLTFSSFETSLLSMIVINQMELWGWKVKAMHLEGNAVIVKDGIEEEWDRESGNLNTLMMEKVRRDLINEQFFAAESLTHNLKSFQVAQPEKLEDDLFFAFDAQSEPNSENLSK